MFDLHNELIKNFPSLPIFYVIANIQDEKKINKIFKANKPDYVFHAAAYKHVPLMEDHPDEAVKNNIFGTLSVANASIKNKVKRFVQVSTDKAANPVSVMGATKLIAEGIIKSLNGKTKFMIVRFGNVLDSNGSVIPIFKKQIENGGPVTVTDKRMTRYFMTIPEAANLILKAASIGRGGELFVLDMGEPVRIIELAENLIRLSGYIPGKDVQVVFTGIRKGEKLSEVLFNDKEKLVSTKEGKIFRTESFGIEIKKMNTILKRLKDKDNKRTLLELSRLIPSFKI
jgi:FlaA1/EpsC-like NDP-sugar epimerase